MNQIIATILVHVRNQCFYFVPFRNFSRQNFHARDHYCNTSCNKYYIHINNRVISICQTTVTYSILLYIYSLRTDINQRITDDFKWIRMASCQFSRWKYVLNEQSERRDYFELLNVLVVPIQVKHHLIYMEPRLYCKTLLKMIPFPSLFLIASTIIG